MSGFGLGFRLGLDNLAIHQICELPLSRYPETLGQDAIFEDSWQDMSIDIAPDQEIIKKFALKKPFDKKCGYHSSMAHSECNTDERVKPIKA